MPKRGADVEKSIVVGKMGADAGMGNCPAGMLSFVRVKKKKEFRILYLDDSETG